MISVKCIVLEELNDKIDKLQKKADWLDCLIECGLGTENWNGNSYTRVEDLAEERGIEVLKE